MNASYDFDRFVAAQTPSYAAALQALEAGGISSDWVGTFFPQLEGLAHCDAAGFYTLQDREEAAAYLAHPVLGPRLIACTKQAIQYAMKGQRALFDHQNDQAFHASITLFSRVKGASAVFESAMFAFYGGTADPRTLKALRLAFTDSLDD